MSGYTREQAALWQAATQLADRGFRIAMVQLGWNTAAGEKTMVRTPPKDWQNADPFPSTQVKAAIDAGCNAYLWRLPEGWWVVDADTAELTAEYTALLGAPDVVTPRGAHWVVDAPAKRLHKLDTGVRGFYGPGSFYPGGDGRLRAYVGVVPAAPRPLPVQLKRPGLEFGPVTPGQPTAMTPEAAAFSVARARDEWLSSVKGGRHETLIRYLAVLTRYRLAQGAGLAELPGELESAALEHPDAVAGEEFETVDSAIEWAVNQARTNPWVLQAAKPDTFDGRFAAPDPAGPAERTGALPTLSGEFWQARPVLSHLRTAAWAKRLAPDAVLHAVLARLAAGRRAAIVIDSGIEDSSLNYFAAIIGASGAGKSRAWRLASRLLDLDPDHCPTRPLGSGEGISEAFMGVVSTVDPETMKPVKLRTQVRHNVLFELDEGQSLTAMLQRSGATVGPALRSAWSGAVLGQQNADAERNRRVTGYATGLVAGFQPDAMQALIDDTHTGMPQRFAFVAAADPALPRDRPAYPGDLPGDLRGVLEGTAANPFGARDVEFGPVVTVPPQVTDELDAALLAVGTGMITPPELDSQRIAMMLRFAGLLALLEGRFAVDDEDWQLAGQLWAVSAGVRDALVTRAAETAERARERANDHYATRQAQVAAEVGGVPDAVARVAKRIALRVRNDGGLTIGQVRQVLASRDRHLFKGAVEYASARGWIDAGEDKLVAGDSRPD
jgi:hypothetical protein